MKKLVVMLALLTLSLTQLEAQWSTDATVNTAVTTATGLQGTTNICNTSDNGYVVVWQDQRSGNYDIYAQKFSSDGTAQWTANGVAICNSTGDQTSPDVASDGSGGAIITWDDSRGANKDIYAQRVNSAGTVQWTANGVAICSATGDQTYPYIDIDESGGAVIAWYDGRATAYSLYAQRVNSAGTVQWTADGVVILSTGFGFTHNIISDGSGGAIISWQKSNDIYAQRVNSAGTVQWTVNGEDICTDGSSQNSCAMTTDGSGGAIIAWKDQRNGNWDVYAQSINSGGTVQWAANGVAVCTATDTQTGIFLEADGSGGAVISWNDNRQLTHYDVYTQKMNSSGVAQWTANGVALATANGSQEVSRIGSDGSGGAVITWVDKAVGSYDIMAQRVNSAGTVQWTAGGEAICSNAAYEDSPRIAADGNGGAAIAFTDDRNGNNDIYIQYINGSGNLGVVPPTVTTTTVTDISVTFATSGGNVTGGASITARGVCWSTSADPTTADSKTTDGTGTGSFTSSITGLTMNTLYHVRAYATNAAGTSYGSDVTFTTVPTLPEWGLIILGTLALALGGWFVFRKFV